MCGAFSTYGKRRSAHRFCWRKPEGKKPLGRPRHRWDKKLGGGMDWFVLAEDRDRWREIVNAVMNCSFPQTVWGGGGEFLDWLRAC